MIDFDIETCPLPPEVCEKFMPEFEAPGNFKDPEKIAAVIAEKRAEWMDKAALSPLTGRVLAIGLGDGDGDPLLIHGEDEVELLNEFLEYTGRIENSPLVGWNIIGFDIPFLMRRMWHHKIKVPKFWTAKPGWGKAPLVIDLMREWNCGDYKAPYLKLDLAAKFLGIPGKTGAHAKDFGKLYKENQAEALAYLSRDVEIVSRIREVIIP
jgi:DNA polymerase elongation subunit (family B)